MVLQRACRTNSLCHSQGHVFGLEQEVDITVSCWVEYQGSDLPYFSDHMAENTLVVMQVYIS